MTSLISWIGVDSRAPSSIYLASDSRITWGNKGTWDNARKVFGSTNYPELLGYCGDVLFPSQALGQLIDLIDLGLFDDNDTPEDKWSAIVDILQKSYEDYPTDHRNPFTIVYCTRKGSGMTLSLHMFMVSWSATGWSRYEPIDLPTHSGIIRIFGSGESVVKKYYNRWNATGVKRTSRCVFGAFCDAIRSGEDKFTGGGPQLVGVYRQEAAKSIGVIYEGNRYLHGLPVCESASLDAVEWRNDIFEVCDWRTMKRLPEAQRHARPRELAPD